MSSAAATTTTAGESYVSMNDQTETDAQLINKISGGENNSSKKNNNKRLLRQPQAQPQQPQQNSEKPDYYYYGSQPPVIPYQAIEEALRPNTGQTIAEKLRNKAECPLCHGFSHHNRYLVSQHISQHPEMAEMRRFTLNMERDYKKLLTRRYQLRKVQLPHLQQTISQLNEQIKRFENAEDTKTTAARIKSEIVSRRAQGLHDLDDDPFSGKNCNFDLGEVEEEVKGGEE